MDFLDLISIIIQAIIIIIIIIAVIIYTEKQIHCNMKFLALNWKTYK